MIIKTEEQLQKMKEIGFICATIRDEMVKKAVPGVSTKELDNMLKNYLKNMMQNLHQLLNTIFQDIHVFH